MVDLAWTWMVGTTCKVNLSNSSNVKFVTTWILLVRFAYYPKHLECQWLGVWIAPLPPSFHVKWTNHWSWKLLLSSFEKWQAHLGPCFPRHLHNLKMRWNHHYFKNPFWGAWGRNKIKFEMKTRGRKEEKPPPYIVHMNILIYILVSNIIWALHCFTLLVMMIK